MKKVLILGAQGNLGFQLVEVFKKDKNYQAIAWDRSDVDFLDFKKLESEIKKEKPETIINATGYNNVDGCEEDEKELKLAYKLNRDLPKKLSEISLDLDAKFINFSTDYVFGREEGRKYYDEKDTPSPLQKYGETKYAGEKEIAKVKLENPKFKYFLIRTSKLFGPKGGSEFAKPSFFDIMINLSKDRDEFNVVHEEEWSCFTFTPDLAKATKKLLEGDFDYGIYHIINEGPATWYTGVLEAFKLAGVKAKVTPVKGDEFPRPAKRPLSSILQNNRFPKLRNYKEALKEYLKK